MRTWQWVWLVGLLSTGAQVGCAGLGVGGAESAEATQRRDTTVVHEECDIDSSDAEKLDANGDGKADITIVRDGKRQLCRAVDLNFDGNIDAWAYFDEQEQIRRREFAFGRDKRIVEIRLYQSGRLKEMHRATTLGGKLDTWHLYDEGKLARTERDSDGDGAVDQWWEYPQPNKPSCPIIHSDVTGDGKPDPDSTVDVCKETGYAPPSREEQYKYKSPDFTRPGTLPTETEEKPDSGEEPAGEEEEPAVPKGEY